MILVFWTFLLIYCLMMALLSLGWYLSPPKPKTSAVLPKISVVIPIRNEIGNIPLLLSDLEKQDYPCHLFEVIVMDDQSDDGSFEWVNSRTNHYQFNLKAVRVNPSGAVSTKKKAITMGVDMAIGEYLLVTDGDCRVPGKWISSFASFFSSGERVFGAGLVAYEGEENFFHRLQSLEFAGLVGIAASTLNLGKPTMCNAANMGFSKQAFIEVGGYANVDHIVSGDDGFLLEKFSGRFGGKVAFLNEKDALVRTKPQESLSGFYHQRKRWASKWRQHKKPQAIVMAIFVFSFHAALLWSLIMAFLGIYPPKLLMVQLALKFSFDMPFFKISCDHLGKKLNFAVMFALEMIYPLYAVFFGIAANLGGYDWKGRDYGSMKEKKQ